MILNGLLFVGETIKAVREAVGNNFALGIRLSQVTVTDPDYQIPEGEAGFRQIAEAVRDAGADFNDCKMAKRLMIWTSPCFSPKPRFLTNWHGAVNRSAESGPH